MRPGVQSILKELRAALERLYGSRLQDLVLFGSFARGQEREGSDLDVAMILDDFDRPWPEIERTGPEVSRLSLQYGLTISLIPVRSKDWAGRDTPLLLALRAEGVPVP